MIVVADTSPPLHLGRIGRLDLLPAVVGRVTIPRTVWSELIQPETRPDVIAAIQAATWIEIVDDPVVRDLGLDPGETAAILLAEQLQADALLIDERRWLLLSPPQNRSGFRQAQACTCAARAARCAAVMASGQRLVLGLRCAFKRFTALVREATRPAAPAIGLVSDILRPRRTLLAEN